MRLPLRAAVNTRRRRHTNLAVQRDRNRVAADVHAARAAATSTGSADQRPHQAVLK